MNRFALAVGVVVLGGCGAGTPEIPKPLVSELTQFLDGTSSVTLTWTEADLTRDDLRRVTANGPGRWLIDTVVSGERKLQLTFGPGFVEEMASRRSYTVSLLFPESGSCGRRCCRGSQVANVELNVELTFDTAGAMTGSSVTQIGR